MSETIIEKGIPIPSKQSIRNKGLVDLLKKLKIGDSIVIPVAKQTNVPSAAFRANVRTATRRIENDQVRVWRIAGNPTKRKKKGAK